MSRPTLVSFILFAGIAAGATAFAQDVSPAGTAPASHAGRSAAAADRSPLRPGDRNCLRSTGSLIPVKEGQCLPVAGRSYSGDELRRTGVNNTARALQMLDPGISVGH
ncbi:MULTISPECIES: hypothetical protein [unclassified Rhodanobacter]|uniref:hypothetical protein n=1 Tax=unclassified Rhodanobacter TaxID=2621553 RepID=UPI000B09ECC9|nr:MULTISPECIES: hypothetical protein [unclassified Rhodanobacter]